MLLHLFVFVHILSTLFWGGGTLLLAFYLYPAMDAAGEGGEQVMTAMVRQGLFKRMSLATGLAVVSGLGLYTIHIYGNLGWVGSPEGIYLSLGGLLGLGAAAIGLVFQRPLVADIHRLLSAVLAAGGPPNAAQSAKLKALQERLANSAKVQALHLAGAALLMSAHQLVGML